MDKMLMCPCGLGIKLLAHGPLGEHSNHTIAQLVCLDGNFTSTDN
jgi:hypothetical protein